MFFEGLGLFEDRKTPRLGERGRHSIQGTFIILLQEDQNLLQVLLNIQPKGGSLVDRLKRLPRIHE